MSTLFARQSLIMIALVIFMTGLIMIFSTTSADLLDSHQSEGMHTGFLKQILYSVAGLILAYQVKKMGCERFLEYTPLLLNVFTILLVLTLVPGIGREVNGSKRWINLLGFSFQPSEFVKIIVPAFFIHEYLKQSEVSLKVFLKLLARSGLPIFLIMIEPNNGTASVIALTLIVAFWLVEVPFKYWAFPLLAACLVGGVFASQLPYVQKRIKVYLNPESDLKGKGHQPYQAKIAAGSGGLYGKGPAKSLQKLSYLPEAQNDYIAAIFAEEFGFLGILALITLYMALLLAGYIIAVQSGTKAGFALGGSIIFLITFQGFLNLGVVSGLLPSTGLNLPLFSQGGTSLMANFVWIALLYDIGGACAAVQKS